DQIPRSDGYRLAAATSGNSVVLGVVLGDVPVTRLANLEGLTGRPHRDTSFMHRGEWTRSGCQWCKASATACHLCAFFSRLHGKPVDTEKKASPNGASLMRDDRCSSNDGSPAKQC